MTSIFPGRIAVAVLMVSGGSAFAQSASATAKPTFEVASVKVLDITKVGISAELLGSLGFKVTAQRATAMLPLEKLIEIAFGLTNNQFLQGPDWLMRPSKPEELGLIAIDAKLPDGSTAQQVPLMLQALLEERFKLTVVKGSKQADVYALVIGKDGPKLQRKAPGSDDDSFAKLSLSLVPTAGKMNVNGGTVTTGKDGSILMEASSSAGLAGMLATQLSPFPVIDKTGLTGPFDIKVSLPPPEIAAILKAGGQITADVVRDSADQRKAALFAAVEKLGLKLEQQKGAVDTIVIGHAERNPTEN